MRQNAAISAIETWLLRNHNSCQHSEREITWLEAFDIAIGEAGPSEEGRTDCGTPGDKDADCNQDAKRKKVIVVFQISLPGDGARGSRKLQKLQDG